MTITSTGEPKDIRIFINGNLHLFISRDDIIALQSWSINEHCSKIEIYTSTRTILLEYDSLEKWKEVLHHLNDHL